MQLKPNYVPKEKKRVNYKLVVPFIVLSAFLFYFGLQKVLPEKVVDTGTKICNLSGKESAKLIAKREYSASIELGDFGQFGESLALYHEPYQIGTSDLFSGKTIFLNNLCHDDERAYMMDVELDRKLTLTDLDDGFYELEILDGLDRFFLTSEDIIDEVFYTMNRGGYVKKVQLRADKSMFKHEGEPITDQNYVYLDVTTIDDPGLDYDLVIDPAKLNESWDGYVDYGVGVDGMTEADYTFKVAEALKDKLAAKNMRVLVLRDNERMKNLSGPKGRLEDAYASGAKYYLSLSFPYSGSVNDYGSTIIYSSYASNSLATEISRSLSETTDLKPSVWAGNDDISGVFPSARDDQYDRTQEIRESGGKLTGAGDLIENPYGKDNLVGMESVYLELGYMSNKEDFSAVDNNIDGIAKAIADALIKNLGL